MHRVSPQIDAALERLAASPTPENFGLAHEAINAELGKLQQRLRDTFAGQALTGLLAGNHVWPPALGRVAAVDAYGIADAMMEERKNG